MSSDAHETPTREHSPESPDNRDDEINTTVPDGEDVDWQQVWEDVGFDPTDDMSTTQLAGAIWASDATGAATDDSAGDLVSDAVDAGVLRECERKSPNGVIVASGYAIADREVDT